MVRAVFFDFDGVLVESVRIKTEAFAELFADELLQRVNKTCRLRLKRIDAKFGYYSDPVRVYAPPKRQVWQLELDPADVARVKSPALKSILEDMLKK